MNIGWIGLGKLGLPCALRLGAAGFRIRGYDQSERIRDMIKNRGPYPHQDDNVDRYLKDDRSIYMCDSIEYVVDHSDMIFVSVQTPHSREFDGTIPVSQLEGRTADFEYGYLISAIRSIVRAAGESQKTIVVISTVLPGTMNRLIKPILPTNIKLLYNPFFIAMGTTIADFAYPEFVLIGADDVEDANDLLAMYNVLHDRPIRVIGIESAELTKVAYNTFISMKIVFGNTIMEICDKTAADADDVIESLFLAKERLLSDEYLYGGMGDGGACHPRDNIAMSHLAKQLHLSVDLMGFISEARDLQTEYIADLARHWCDLTNMSVCILGKAYKPNTKLKDGSPAILLDCILQIKRMKAEHIGDGEEIPDRKKVFVIGTQHDQYMTHEFPEGSVIIDPWGYIPHKEGVTLIRVGRK